MWYIYNLILFSHIKEWNNAIWSNIDGPRDYNTKWSKTNKDKYHIISLIFKLKKIVQMNLQNKNRFTDRKQAYGYQRRKEGGEIGSLRWTDAVYW